MDKLMCLGQDRSEPNLVSKLLLIWKLITIIRFVNVGVWEKIPSTLFALWALRLYGEEAIL